MTRPDGGEWVRGTLSNGRAVEVLARLVPQYMSDERLALPLMRGGWELRPVAPDRRTVVGPGLAPGTRRVISSAPTAASAVAVARLREQRGDLQRG